MSTKLGQSPITGRHVFPSLSISMEFLNSYRPSCSTYAKPRCKNKATLSKYDNHFGTRSTFSSFSRKVVQEGSSWMEIGLQSEDDKSTVVQLKAQLYDSLEGINRGIFGVPSAKKTEIEELVKLIESKNPTFEPTEQLEKVAGWNLEACFQHYHHPWIQTNKAWVARLYIFRGLPPNNQHSRVNVIKFSARGFDLLSGQLQIDASFKIATKSRVEISYSGSSITPEQLMSLFRKNYDLLLSIFNPDGWLEITYVDNTLRIGRDDKENIFILERLSPSDGA